MGISLRKAITTSMSAMDNLPSPPALLGNLRTLLSHEKCSNTEVAALFETAPQIRERVRQVALAPLLDSGHSLSRSAKIQELAAVLGAKELYEVTLGVAAIDAFSKLPTVTGFDSAGFWQHAACVGIAGQTILRFAGPAAAEISASEAYLAGLCHDFGKLLLAAEYPDAFRDVMEYVEQESALMIDAEAHLLQIGHDEMSAIFADSWGFAPKLVAAIRWHHNPAACSHAKHRSFAQVLQLADFICNHQNLGSSGNARVPDLPLESFTALDLDARVIPEIIAGVRQRVTQTQLTAAIGYSLEIGK